MSLRNLSGIIPAAALAIAMVMGGCMKTDRNVGSVDTAIEHTDSAAIADTAALADTPPAKAIPAGAQALVDAYPDMISGFENNEIIFTDGSRMQYDDGREKDFATMLDDSDIEDMFSMTYEVKNPPEYLADAGRSRSEALFKKMYGDSSGNVRKKTG